MKKILTFAFAALALAACTKEQPQPAPTGEQQMTIKFSPYEMSPMKTQSGVGTVCSRLDVYIKNEEGDRAYYCYLETCNKEDTDYVLIANDESNVTMTGQDDFIHLYGSLYRMGFWWDDAICEKVA